MGIGRTNKIASPCRPDLDVSPRSIRRQGCEFPVEMRVTAVDKENLPGCVAGAGRGEKDEHVRHFLAGREAASTHRSK